MNVIISSSFGGGSTVWSFEVHSQIFFGQVWKERSSFFVRNSSKSTRDNPRYTVHISKNTQPKEYISAARPRGSQRATTDGSGGGESGPISRVTIDSGRIRCALTPPVNLPLYVAPLGMRASDRASQAFNCQADSPGKAASAVKSLQCVSPVQHYSCSNRMHTGLRRSPVLVVSQSLELRAVMYW
jgi:hypothetical protein